ncbi:M20/M25/M40 family metallo-hydrolase [Saccharothrix texasensis]|uniref:Zn-dependent M28 family amino/carboxypeptidase n=1 Tax=Saccharothrix texasensis TaxID=103734 RepID=A0A3N1H1X7_9PSEU|nr:M20/M25/M40 family metallo-hydrolase [Saccharothrix texasensis]ROP36479.1 Zn-dependent M28 family amino/carboxypeptidase [Saccharothrix texasensis]
MVEGARRVLVLLIVIAGVGVTAVLGFRPPSPVADAPPAEFAAGRAERHLAAIAQRPHPIGSADNGRVRDYIVDTARGLGADVTVESDDVVRPWRGVRVATTHNVVARVPGAEPSVSGGKALLLVAHYDSVPTGPGAADDGAAVAAMLETLRALTTGGVRNDVVFLFTDGEEAGALGADAYVRRHGVDGVGAVLNWEARGSGGPVWMFQTGADNAPLVSAFGQASSRPIANSFAYEVYRRMPNYSDFTIFQDAGARGLNSAFIEHVHDYHSPYDDLSRLDRGSLQHHGETMVGLVRALGDRDLRAGGGGGDAVYFDLFSRVLVHYPTWLAVALAAVTVVALASALVAGVRSGRLRWPGVLGVAGVAVGAVVVAGAVSFGAWALVAAVRPGLGFLALSEPHERGWFVAGFCVLGSAVLVAAARVARRWSPAEVVAGVLVVTAVLLAATTVAVPGAGFLFQWTLLLGLPALWTTRLAFVAPLVAAAIFPPLVGTMMVALGMPLSAVAVVFAALAGVLLLPLLPSGSWWPALGVTAVAVVLIAVGTARFGFAPDEPRPDSLVYLQDTGGASWLSADPAPDEWTSRVLGENPERVTLPYPALDKPMMRAAAPDLRLPAPGVTAVAATDGPVRTVTFRVTPNTRAWRTHVTLSDPGRRSCRLGSTDLPGSVLDLYGPSSREITCELDPGTPLEVAVADQWAGLPTEATALIGPRPPDTMPVQSGSRAFDAAVVRAEFRL